MPTAIKKAPPKKPGKKSKNTAVAAPRKPKLGFGAKVGVIAINGDITKPVALWR